MNKKMTAIGLVLAWVVTAHAQQPAGAAHADREPAQQFLKETGVTGRQTAELPMAEPSREPFAAALLAARGMTTSAWPALLLEWEQLHPYAADWLWQDADARHGGAWLAGAQPGFFPARCRQVAAELSTVPAALRTRLERLGEGTDDATALALYLDLAVARRHQRLQPLLAQTRQIFFTRFDDRSNGFSIRIGGGRTLSVLTFAGVFGTVEDVVADPAGEAWVRDPAVDFEGQRLLFSAGTRAGMHLYEMDLATRARRAITTGAGAHDYQGAYLPDGGIVFNSTRCVQTCDCIDLPVFNLYRVERDGTELRRLGFDQVSVSHPTVLDDGRVIYTRWEYNDRGQIFPQPLFQMNPDGTGQTEYYGNNSWFPTSLHHARGIPGTRLVLAIASGHHTPQSGKLAIVDVGQGRQENEGITLVAPPCVPPAVRVDRWGQDGDQFQYPYPLGEDQFLVAYAPEGHRRLQKLESTRYRIYWLNRAGQRELLVTDLEVSCTQPVPLMARPRPHVRPISVDLRRSTGTVYLQDVHAGPGLAGLPRSTAQRLRVVELVYRRASIGCSFNRGPAGGDWHVRTPVSITGSWDVKIIHGEADIYPDGSAFFEAPANTPLYFQVLDANQHVVQTMRSWVTLMPGENAACVGCHEPKHRTPLATATVTRALRAGVQSLRPFYGPPRGFSFPKEIQPILDRHCGSCHNGPRWPVPNSPAEVATVARRLTTGRPFSLRGNLATEVLAARQWSDAYVGLLRPFLAKHPVVQRGKARVEQPLLLLAMPSALVNWVSPQSVPTMLEPYHAGAARSALLPLLKNGHQGVRLSAEELDKLAAWIDLQVPFCGDYLEAHDWSEQELDLWRRQEQLAAQFQAQEARPSPAPGNSERATAPHVIGGPTKRSHLVPVDQ